jgi:O-acetyl-ADP-ribose deacetylase (regulator of RNase III)
VEVKIGPALLRVREGDITSFSGDAIVNAANNHLWMGAGVAGAIRRKGGPIIESEAVAQGPIPVGEAVETTAGALSVSYVIHAAVMGQDLQTSAKLIRQATRSSLEVADRLGIRSVAFPAFGTGVGGFPLDSCARTMYGAIREYLEGVPESSLREVALVLFGREAFLVFEQELGRFFNL